MENARKYIVTEIAFARDLGTWRLVPWYETYTCEQGCCFVRQFQWLFFRVRRIHTTLKQGE